MKRKNLWAAFIAVIGVVLAVGITVYPLISSKLSEQNKSLVLTEYAKNVEAIDDSGIEDMLAAAQEYNTSLVPGPHEAFSRDAILAASEEYYDLLNINEDGMMGYVEIPKIAVYLPIYHGTDAETLDIGVGHLLGSSLPVGGSSTHAVLTGHSGMATEKMFTDLDQLKPGDCFYVHVLNSTLAYEVDQIKIVLPENTDYLGIEKEADYCTLVTCTPYAVNTHRLLVRGHRTDYEEPAESEAIPEAVPAEAAPSTWTQEYIKGILITLLIAAITTVCLLILQPFRKRGKHERR